MAVAEAVDDLIPGIDRRFLIEKGFNYTLRRIDGEVHLVIKDFPLPEAYIPRAANLLVILRPGYPNTGPDMFFTVPDVKLRSGAWPNACAARAVHGGISWQQWSRHINGRWRPGTDGLRSYIACIRRELAKGV